MHHYIRTRLRVRRWGRLIALLCLAVTILTIITLHRRGSIFKGSNTLVPSGAGYNTDSNLALSNLLQQRPRVWRRAKNSSPFLIVDNRIKKGSPYSHNWIGSLLHRVFGDGLVDDEILEEEKSFLNSLNDDPNGKNSKLNLCRLLVAALYQSDMNWKNEDTFTFYNNDAIDDEMVALLSERLRLNDYCFIQGELSALEVFDTAFFEKNGITAWDYQKRMFPFIDADFDKENNFMWPEVIDLMADTPTVVKNSEFNEEVPPSEFNANFMKYWRKYSKGMGIAVTLNRNSIPIFVRQLRIFQKLNNTLPIQIILSGREYSEEFVAELASAVKPFNQQVYVVNVSPFADLEFSRHMIWRFFNKWFAVLFNTFEEVLFIDIDAIPFQNLEKFFEKPEYQESGLYLYRDRDLPLEGIPEFCVSMMRQLEPSLNEARLIGTKLKFDRNYHEHEPSTVEGKIYNNFFRDRKLHHVDSGLLILNKKKRISGILLSMMMNFVRRMQACVYGDKEFFWLGQLFAGGDYSIDKYIGGVIGPVSTFYDEDSGKTWYQLCASQLAHRDDHGLVWSNGGLRTCKLDNAAKLDFDKNPDYFKERYGNLENLEAVYDQPLHIEGFVAPDTERRPWFQINECSSYVYCGAVYEGESGTAVVFGPSDAEWYNEISSLWNE